MFDIENFSIEFWVVFQLAIDLFLILFILYYLRGLKASIKKDVARETAERVIGIIEPLMKEAASIAKEFDLQIQEKNRLIKSINQNLDNKIISLNLLLNRADAHLKSDSKPKQSESLKDQNDIIYDQQNAIVELYSKGYDAQKIAEHLSLPKGEVDLVLDLKKKLLIMEKNSKIS